jgi:hypothetical protein
MNLTSRTKMFDAVVSSYPDTRALGGRSMGARAAVMCANTQEDDSGKGAQNMVLVSYPLHTAKDTRDQILMAIDWKTRVLFVIGDQDKMCELERLEEVRRKMKARSWRIVVKGADHGMNVHPKIGTRGVGELIGEVVEDWLKGNVEEDREGMVWWDGEDEEAIWSGWKLDCSHQGCRTTLSRDQEEPLQTKKIMGRKPSKWETSKGGLDEVDNDAGVNISARKLRSSDTSRNTQTSVVKQIKARKRCASNNNFQGNGSRATKKKMANPDEDKISEPIIPHMIPKAPKSWNNDIKATLKARP